MSPGRVVPALLLLLALLAVSSPFQASISLAAGASHDAESPKQQESAWGEMPAGARSVYIGIHGGTVPVSLLTAGDGSPMIAQVGLTGTDFLHFMRRGTAASDDTSLVPAALPDSGSDSGLKNGQTDPPARLPQNKATLLLAGRSQGDVPVIYATGRNFERLSLVPTNWAPFGLTETPLSLEGEVRILNQPRKLPRYRRGRRLR